MVVAAVVVVELLRVILAVVGEKLAVAVAAAELELVVVPVAWIAFWQPLEEPVCLSERQ